MAQKIILVIDYKICWNWGCFISYVTHKLWGTTKFYIGHFIISHLCQFADDTNIFISDKSIDYCFEIWNNELINHSELFKANKLFISNSCVSLINELETYSYPDRRSGRNEDEKPIDENNHAIDAIRYALMMHSFREDSETLSVYIPEYD